MIEHSAAKNQLAEIVKSLASEKKDTLDRLKGEYLQLRRPDFIWHFLLQSFSTMGNSRGWDGLIGNQNNYKKVTFESLSPQSSVKRLQTIEQTLRDAKVRMPVQKAEWLNNNFTYILKLGGLVSSKEKLLRQPGKEGMIKFLKTFQGIGEKYARNIMMDVYHPYFYESIAIDDRIKNISKELGLSFQNYHEQENFFLEVAHTAGINGWELDRLMYNFKDEIIYKLKIKSPANNKMKTIITRLRKKPTKCK